MLLFSHPRRASTPATCPFSTSRISRTTAECPSTACGPKAGTRPIAIVEAFRRSTRVLAHRSEGRHLDSTEDKPKEMAGEERRPRGVRGALFLLDSVRRRVVWVGVASLIGAALEAAFLVVVTRVALEINDGSDTTTVVGRTFDVSTVIACSVAIIVARLAFAAASSWLSADVASRVTAELRHRLVRGFVESEWSVQQGERPGHLQELLSTYVSQAANFVTSIATSIAASLSLLAMLGSALVLDPVSSAAVLVILGVFGSLLRPVRSAVRRQSGVWAGASMEFSTSVTEVSSLGLETHIFGVEKQVRTRMERLIAACEVSARKLLYLRGLIPALYASLAYLALLAALALMAAMGNEGLSSVGAVMLIMLRSLGYGQSLQTAISTAHSALPFIDSIRLQETTYDEGRRREGDVPLKEVGDLHLEHVSFAYPTGPEVLSDINLHVARGELIGIVGPSGSGKSTLVQLILGLRQPTAGRILVNGSDLTDVRRADWARRVTFVPQQPRMFAGSVGANVEFFRPDVALDDVVEASRRANLHGDVVEWDEGYDREVGASGGNLSGGQQQRLIIARALVESPDLLVLDEPTSALDANSAHLIRAAIESLRGETTVIVIAHSLSTVERCDRIVVIEGGRITAEGTPEMLGRIPGFYASILKMSEAPRH